MSESNDESSPQTALVTPHYAPPSPRTRWYRQRRFVLAALIGLAAVIATLTLLAIWEPIQQWNISRLQNKCLTYSPSEEQLVFSNLPEDANKLMATSEEYSILNSNPRAMGLVPSQWVAFHRAYFSYQKFSARPPSCSSPVIFLGERTSKRWERFFLCVSYVGFGGKSPWVAATQPDSGAYYPLEFEYTAMTIRSPSSSRLLTYIGRQTLWATQPPKELRFFAGQHHPTDPHGFSVRYEINGQSGQLEGFVEIDGSIYFISDGPLKCLPSGFRPR